MQQVLAYQAGKLVPTREDLVLAATCAYASGGNNNPPGYDPVYGSMLALPGQYPVQSLKSQQVLPALDLRYWSVVFPRPNMASLVHADDNTLNVNLAFGDCDQTFSVQWLQQSADHQMAAYQPQLFVGLKWTFSVQLMDANVIPFDQNYGLTLTVNTSSGQYIVRLWNYALPGSTNTNATFALDFNNLRPGWAADGAPIDPSTIQLIFFTFTHPSYGLGVKQASFVNSTVAIKQVSYTGPGLSVNVPNVSDHGTNMTVGYDDLYDKTPKRIVDQIVGLGYSGFCTLYIGMSHFMKLGWNAADARFEFTGDALPICAPSVAWFQDFYNRLKAAGITIIWSLSYEMFASYAPANWAQLDYTGAPAYTGYNPPSEILAFTRSDVMAYLQNTAAHCVSLQAAGETPYLQVGEPWWWDGSYDNNAPCFYDPTTVALFAEQNPGQSMARFTSSAQVPTTPEELATAQWLGKQLGLSTLSVIQHVKSLYPRTKGGVLFYTPQAFAGTLLRMVNYPQAQWQSPNLDFFQIESYDQVTNNELDLVNSQFVQIKAQLGYANSQFHYFAGFVNNGLDAVAQWPLIYQSMGLAMRQQIQHTAIWSYSQIVRDSVLLYAPWRFVPAGYPTLSGEMINEAVQMLIAQAQTQLGLSNPTFYFYGSADGTVFEIIAGPPGMVETTQTQPQHARLQLVLNDAGLVVQVGSCFITSKTFPAAAPLNPPNQV
jgi:hypothetical protein